MAIYLKKFETQAAYEAAQSGLILPNVSLTVDNNTVHYNPSSPVPPTPSHEYVDLGLPSGTKWAKTNLGATNEEDDGLYFAWGETMGYADANARNAALGGADGFGSTNYTNGGASGISADLTLAQDTANIAYGGSWRMPTKTEFEELINTSNTDREWTQINGVNGWKFMKKSDHSVYVFFPASGMYNGASLGSKGSRGYCWSATYNSSSSAYLLSFLDSSVYTSNYSRKYGLTVRPVLG